MRDKHGTRWEDDGIQASGNELGTTIYPMGAGCPGAVKALPLLTVLEDVLEEASAQQVSSALC